MKALLKIFVGVMVSSLVILFIKPSIIHFLSGWHSFDDILIKIAGACAIILFFGYYAVLLWDKHGRRTP